MAELSCADKTNIKLVAMAMSLERWKNLFQTTDIHANLMKIGGPVNVEIISLTEIARRKISCSESSHNPCLRRTRSAYRVCAQAAMTLCACTVTDRLLVDVTPRIFIETLRNIQSPEFGTKCQRKVP